MSIFVTGIIKGRDFDNFRIDDGENYHIDYLGNLNVWKGKLYFYVSGTSRGVFSYCPQTDKLELLTEDLEIQASAHLHKNKAYWHRTLNADEKVDWEKSIEDQYDIYSSEYNEITRDAMPTTIISFDIETKEKVESFMPILRYRDWPDYVVDDEYKDKIVSTSWYTPFYINGYLYTSLNGALNPVRFQADNLEKYEILSSGLSPVWEYGSLRNPFVAKDDLIMAYNYDKTALDTFSNTNLQTINTFDNMIYNWQFYEDNYLVCSGYGIKDGSAIAFRVNEGKAVAYVDEQYSKMLDTIYLNNTVYAFSDTWLEDLDYDGLVLYQIPWSKMFKKDTVLDDYAQPLFD